MHALEVCKWWLESGFQLLPCSAGTKRLLQGYGPHLARIQNLDQANIFWGGPSGGVNLAVCTTEHQVILDFDSLSVYTTWASTFTREASTYTEVTPRGGRHVFVIGEHIRGLRLKAGVELKQVCLVYPSKVEGKQYTRGAEIDILEADTEKILSPLSEAGYPTPYRVKATAFSERQSMRAGSILDRVKAHFRVVDILVNSRPSVAITGTGRFLVTRCPFHKAGKEEHPSFWIDTERNLWGCHGCPNHGDVINLYALLNQITNYEAIRELAKGLP